MSTLAEQLFDKGYAETEETLLDGKVTARLRNISALRQLKLEEEMSKIEGSTAFILHTYSVKLLEMTLIEYKGKQLAGIADARKLIETLPGAVVDYLIKKQSAFEKDVAKAFTGEEIEETFFETPSTDSDSKPQSEAVTSESVTAIAS
ncbi:MAG: hypothetical protein H8E12_14790 [Rhodobacteraceae bacterium]|nr:hypothetical protein [Paracoccaceae bacterium]